MNRRGFLTAGGLLSAGLVSAAAGMPAASRVRAAETATAARVPGPGLTKGGKLPPFGDFRHQVLLGPCTFPVSTHMPDFAPFGLVLDGGWIYGQFRDADGNILSVLRKVAGYWTGQLNINANLDGGQLLTHPAPSRSYAGGLLVESKKNRITWRSYPGAAPSLQPFSYTQDEETCEWREGDLLSIDGQLMKPGMQWLDMSPEAGGARASGMYGLQVVKAEGTMLGRPVKGWFGYDFIFLPYGQPWEASPYYRRLEVAYHTLANAYDDGSVEYGMICYGLEDWTFGIISDGNGLKICTRNVDVQITAKPNGFPQDILYNLDGVKYHWRADPRGELHGRAGGVGGIYRGAEGHCQRVGDTRKIVNGLGWIDFFNDDRSKSKLVSAINFEG